MAEWPMPNPPGLGLPNPMSYDTSTAGIVVDRVTCLIWERVFDNTTYTRPQAMLYCDGLTLGGYTDWRIPTYIELLSLVDFTRGSPAIDPVAFPSTPAQTFWTTSANAVSFIRGEPVAPGSMNRVRCVR